MDLDSKTVLITGAARGLGAAIARELANRGVDLALVDLDESSLRTTQSACEELGARVRNYSADVAQEPAVVDLFERVVADFGRLDALINNAGILRDGLLVKARDGAVTEKLSLEQWQAVIAGKVNQRFVILKGASPTLLPSGLLQEPVAGGRGG